MSKLRSFFSFAVNLGLAPFFFGGAAAFVAADMEVTSWGTTDDTSSVRFVLSTMDWSGGGGGDFGVRAAASASAAAWASLSFDGQFSR